VGQSGVIHLGTIFRLQVLPFKAKPRGVYQLNITCSFPLILAVLNGVWAIIAAYKLPEQSPTLLLKQLTQIYEYTHISRLLYAYCTPVTATVRFRPVPPAYRVSSTSYQILASRRSWRQRAGPFWLVTISGDIDPPLIDILSPSNERI
jgi:hypothetical protein